MDWDSIPRANIIAVFPAEGDDTGSQHDVLYAVESKNGSEEEKAPSLSFRAAKVHHRPNINVLVSTGSGTGLATATFESLVKPLLDHLKIKYAVQSTKSDRSILELGQTIFLTRANRGLEQGMILLSGDGGVVDLVNALGASKLRHSNQYKKPTLAILPLGTGNALAHSAGVTADKTMGLATMLRGAPSSIPIFRARFSRGAKLLVNEGREERELDSIDADGHPNAQGAVVFSWGFHATLVGDSDTAEYRKFGAERFKMAAKEALYPSDGSPPHDYSGKVSILRSGPLGPKPIDRTHHAYVLATFCSHLESGFNISPASMPLDGKLRLIHFGPLGPEQVMDVMHKAYDNGRHVDDSRVGYEEVEGIRIDFDEEDGQWRRVCIDGRIIRVEKGGWVEVRKDSTKVLDLLVEQQKQ
ncbi:hypothetical protein K431DRAFT_318250 [Polychaeton citri CBS 116435]|uniref:DAGKc domain-containing protein n=1 Tax=Polychaeton citri CBS 116435 TaxID=1314669 RepID=A0A9P4QC40_9PEZI|nr:hypothetical protein K431DRAFT_318250 [Polychaeton citri CBS 116435]